MPPRRQRGSCSWQFLSSDGADIDKRILFQEGRIKTYYCDQTNKNDIKLLWDNEEFKNIEFDIIIEDGLHEFSANLIFLENSIHKLKVGGYYICEDLTIYTENMFKQIIPELKSRFPNHIFEIKKFENKQNKMDNTLLVVQKLK